MKFTDDSNKYWSNTMDKENLKSHRSLPSQCNKKCWFMGLKLASKYVHCSFIKLHEMHWRFNNPSVEALGGENTSEQIYFTVAAVSEQFYINWRHLSEFAQEFLTGLWLMVHKQGQLHYSCEKRYMLFSVIRQ